MNFTTSRGSRSCRLLYRLLRGDKPFRPHRRTLQTSASKPAVQASPYEQSRAAFRQEKGSDAAHYWARRVVTSGLEPVTGFLHIFLRDACTCPRCVHPTTKQKNFQTTDIPAEIRAHNVKILENGDVQMEWLNDVRGFDHDGTGHVSTFSSKWIENNKNKNKFYDYDPTYLQRHWMAEEIQQRLTKIDFADYQNVDLALYTALTHLNVYGIVIIRNVPDSEKAVEEIAGRIGTIRDTSYGRTWDVKSKPEAKNVAYTHQFLGLHMDLLYMADPPGFQFLHCLRNSCQGGDSLFSDAFRAAHTLHRADWDTLVDRRHKITYHYNNDGQHYQFKHRVLETVGSNKTDAKAKIVHVNYSPPFQAPFMAQASSTHGFEQKFLPALRNFAQAVEDPQNLFRYRLGEGECVIFNNRRILHGRTAFDAGGGERWLKGTYVDTDVFNSRWRVLFDQLGRPSVRTILGNVVPRSERRLHVGNIERNRDSVRY